MSVKVTVRNVVEGEQDLSALMKAEGFEAKVNYRIAKMIKKIEAPLTAFKSAQMKAFDTYGEIERDEEGKETGNKRIKVENMEKYSAEMKALLDEEVELDAKIPIPGNYTKLTAQNLLRLEPFVEVVE